MKNILTKISRLLLMLPLSLACANARGEMRSEPYVWKNVKVVAGGFVPGIVFSRVEKGLAYCRTDIGGCYRWDDSQKKWIPMTDSIGESSYFGGESIAPDPIDANVVYTAAGMYSNENAAMLRSRDKGKTWDIFPVTFRMGGNEDGRGVGERLAVDPSDHRVLYFGSRYEGLWKSTDSAETWTKVKTFPLPGLGNRRGGEPPKGGLSFVVFDPRGAAKGSPCNTIYVGSADPGEQHLFRSDDSGHTWQAVSGQPTQLFAAKAELDDDGILYVTYGDGIGPNGVKDGAVWKLDTKSNQWTDITPEKGPDRREGGYFGLSLDRQHPGTLGVATMNHWKPIDTIWRTTDGGRSWANITEKSERDVSLSPYLLWGMPKARLGWWMSAFAIDPFNSDHAAYGTGATIYSTDEFSKVNKNEPTHWNVWADGMEETAVVAAISPTVGPHVISAFGDIAGFAHDDLDVSPKDMFENPQFVTTVMLDYAGDQPAVIVRGGHPKDGDLPFGYSEDGGHSWHPLKSPAQRTPGRRGNMPAITVSADGGTFVLTMNPPVYSRDRGQNWAPVGGLPRGGRPVPDRRDGRKFYSLDFSTTKFYTSTDGGASFIETPTRGLPADISADHPTGAEAAWPLIATTGITGDLWFAGKSGLFHSTDGGKNFQKTPGGLHVQMLSMGKAPPGKDYPALFAVGKMNELRAIWRSDDAGESWIRVNDDQHQYGTRFRCISGDPRIFGRVYFGTDGRGLFYGQPAAGAQ